MRIGLALAALALLAVPALAEEPARVTIQGDYAEFRTADVYTGPCVANAEVGLAGHEAVLAWRVRQGSWSGIAIDGLSVIAVVRASATLGDPYADPQPAKAVIIVDARATPAERAALVGFASSQAPDLLSDVMAVESSPIVFEHGAHGFVTVAAGNLATLSTRPFNDKDHFCFNEEVFYQPLAANLDHAMAAMTVEGAYQGQHLGATWRESSRRGSFVGTFAVSALRAE
ncbi:MAG: DUF1326 domain-containing protein [Gemmatimonadetes bacterium]|nr:DUF1326 domain-containing protein [Gemmatimonadota bacterium]